MKTVHLFLILNMLLNLLYALLSFIYFFYLTRNFTHLLSPTGNFRGCQITELSLTIYLQPPQFNSSCCTLRSRRGVEQSKLPFILASNCGLRSGLHDCAPPLINCTSCYTYLCPMAPTLFPRLLFQFCYLSTPKTVLKLCSELKRKKDNLSGLVNYSGLESIVENFCKVKSTVEHLGFFLNKKGQ